MPTQDRELSQEWQEFVDKHGVDAVPCVNWAEVWRTLYTGGGKPVLVGLLHPLVRGRVLDRYPFPIGIKPPRRGPC